jgi:hypothetical protein
LSPTASISLNQTNVRTLAGVPSGTIIMPTNFYGKSSWRPTQQGIVAMGGREDSSIAYSGRQLITTTGVVGATAATVGPARRNLTALTYGGDKAIINSGDAPAGYVNVNNLVSNTGVVATSTPSAGTALAQRGATTYGGDRGIVAFGRTQPNTYVNTRNLVSNTGVFAADIPGVGITRTFPAMVTYGAQAQTAVSFGGSTLSGFPLGRLQVVNYISNTGVMGSDTPTTAKARDAHAGATYGNDKAVFYGGSGYTNPTGPTSGTSRQNLLNYVTNTGVLGADISAAPQSAAGKEGVCGAGFGGDKGILMYGATSSNSATTNTVSNTGVWGSAITYSTTPEFRLGAAAAGLSYT